MKSGQIYRLIAIAKDIVKTQSAAQVEQVLIESNDKRRRRRKENSTVAKCDEIIILINRKRKREFKEQQPRIRQR